jgi:hypothetical protein
VSLFKPEIWGHDAWAPFVELLTQFLEKQSLEAGSDEWTDCDDSPSHDVVHVPDAASGSLSKQPRSATLAPLESSGKCGPATSRSPCITEQARDSATLDVTFLLPATQEDERGAASGANPSSACIQSQTHAAIRLFRAAKAPQVGLAAYIQRIGRYTGCSAVCLLYALSYVLRLHHTHRIPLTSFTIHRCAPP